MSSSTLLAEYNRKRDFKKTAEPAGKIAHSEGGNRFIVQKHEATRLHWDFRLEADGVLKSWAVTKGPSPDPDIKRLAVRTEDHPLSYAEFEGIIPKGEYGGGNVMLWDKGTWEPVPGKSWKNLEKGHLHFVLHGERMKGEWLLIRLKKRPGEKRENWLLRKLDDEYAQPGDPLVEQGLTSVLTGRTMAEIAGDKKGEFSLSGKSDRAFKAQMKKAAERNAEVGKGQKAAKLPKGASMAGHGGRAPPPPQGRIARTQPPAPGRGSFASGPARAGPLCRPCRSASRLRAPSCPFATPPSARSGWRRSPATLACGCRTPAPDG